MRKPIRSNLTFWIPAALALHLAVLQPSAGRADGCQSQACGFDNGTFICYEAFGLTCSVSLEINYCTTSLCDLSIEEAELAPLATDFADRCRAEIETRREAADTREPASLSQGHLVIMDLRFPREKAPAVLYAAEFGGPSDVFRGGDIINLTDKGIAAFKIGWVLTWSNSAREVFIGVRQLAEPGDTGSRDFYSVPSDIGDTGLGEELSATGPKTAHAASVRRISFFLAEAEFHDGEIWQAKLTAAAE